MIAHSKNLVFSLYLLFSCIAIPTIAFADDDVWRAFQKDNKLYECRIPKGFTTESHELIVADDVAASYDRIESNIENENDPAALKEYKIKLTQTLGAPLTKNQAKAIIERYLNGHANALIELNAIQKNREIHSTKNGFYGGDIYLTYEDPLLGKRGLRARIHISGITKVEQVLKAPDSSIYSFRNKDFFNSVRFSGYHAPAEGSITKSWPLYTSELGLFTAHLPDITEPYVPKEPSFKSSKRFEIMRFEFFDPVLEQKIFYNVYGYTFNTPLHRDAVIEVLKKRHLMKWGPMPRHPLFSPVVKDKNDFNLLHTEYPIKPSDKFDHANLGRLEANFIGKKMIVHEIISSQELVRSNFVDNVKNGVTFYPYGAPPPALTEKNAESEAP